MGRSRRAAPMRRPAARPMPQRKTPPPLAPHAAPPPATHGDNRSAGGGLFSTIAQGFAFGTGSSLAHRAVGGIVDGVAPTDRAIPDVADRQQQQQQQRAQPLNDNACELDQRNFFACLRDQQEVGGGDVGQCQRFFEALRQCQTDAKGQFA